MSTLQEGWEVRLLHEAEMGVDPTMAQRVPAVQRDTMRERQLRACRRSVLIVRRKGEDTFAMKRRRMPYVAKIRRSPRWQ